MSKEEISIQFSKAIEMADELYDLSKILTDIGSVKMEEALKLLSESWKSESASTYVRRTRYLKKRLYSSAEMLNDTSNLIRQTAKKIYDAEMTAVSVFTARNY